MRDDQEPRTDHPAEGVNVPYPGIQTAHDMEEAEEHLLDSGIDLEANELHAAGQTCAHVGSSQCMQTMGTVAIVWLRSR